MIALIKVVIIITNNLNFVCFFLQFTLLLIIINMIKTLITYLVCYLQVNDWKSFLEFGLVEVLLKSLISLMHLKNNLLSDLCMPERNILVSDINSFLSTIVVHSLQMTGNNVQVFLELV